MKDFFKRIFGMGKRKEWSQGVFKPQVPEKCINVQMGRKVIYRSSWEHRLFSWADQNKNVVKWGSEIIKIPYVYDLDKAKGINKIRNYYPDVYMELKDKQDKIHTYILEIKPVKQGLRPKLPKRKTKKSMKNYYTSLAMCIQNENKWKYAKMFCDGKNWKFRTVTEKDLFRGKN